jgi:STE24 endopeptidase
VALVAAVVIAEAAVLVLRPRETGPDPVPVPPRAYFSAAELNRAEDFRAGQRRLFLLATLTELGVLVLLVRRPLPLRSAVATAAAVSVAVGVAGLPVGAIARERAKDVGLVTQGLGGWAADVGKGLAIGAVIAGAGGGLLLLSMRRLGERWWIAGAVVVTGFAAGITYAGPVVLDPLFNRFTPLPAGELRTDVVRLAEEAGLDVGEVLVMDASRRTTAANAYVTGLGHTKRVVLYDTLLEDFSPEEVRLVVAHELGHVHHRDVPNGLLFVAIVAPFGLLAAARIGEALGGGAGAEARRVIPATALALALVVPVVTAASSQLSRAVEKRADFFALELTQDAEALIGFERRITLKNVGDPDPPAAWHALFGTHPTALERIGQALAVKDSRP